MKVYIRTCDYADTVEIAFIDERDGRRYVAKPIQLEFVEVKEGEMTEPTLKIWGRLAGDFLKAMANAIQKFGIKPDLNYVEGKLEATKKHLEDMRKLVFKRNTNDHT